jgi:LPS-assembly lipoprotein
MRALINPLYRATIVGLAFLLMGLSACGFQLRGANLEGIQDTKIYVQSSGASVLAAEVKSQLIDNGINPVSSISDAEYIVNLSNESFNTRVLAVSPDTGKAEEYQVSYTAMLRISTPEEISTAATEPVSATRDLTFDEGSVLGKVQEESILKRDIAKQVAASVLRRLRAAIQ